MFAGTTVLVTGARGGIGRALVAGFLEAGAQRIIAANRTPGAVFEDPRIESCVLDVVDHAAVQAVAERIGTIDILVNNAGVNGNRGLFEPEAAACARREMEVNYLGTLNMVQAFGAMMRARRSGTIVQLLSFVALANLPLMATYSASKAASYSLTQALRAELAPFGVRVCGVFPRMVDTPMAAHVPAHKLSPEALAAAVIAGLRTDAEDIFPGEAAAAYTAFLADPGCLERQNASRLPATSRSLISAGAE